MAKGRTERRTALITAGGIAAVIVAGAFAVGANIGILDASSDNQIGALSAAGDLVPTTGATPASVTTARATPATSQTYLVDVAGTVSIDPRDGALVVSAVGANPGWTWTGGASDATHVKLTFTDGVRSLAFTATRAADGGIDASVDEPTSHPASAATAATGPSAHHDSDDEEHEEHEGRDDDD